MITYEMIDNAQKDIIMAWDDAGKKVIEICARSNPINLSAAEFLKHCTACGGNWGGMLLSGLRKLRPEVWEAIPDDMGSLAWLGIGSTLILCGVDTSEEG